MEQETIAQSASSDIISAAIRGEKESLLIVHFFTQFYSRNRKNC